MVFRALFVLLASLAHAQAIACPYSTESYSEWMQNYFREPNPEVLFCSLEYYSDSELFADYPNARVPTAYFFASALPNDQYASLFSVLSKNASLESKMFGLHVFWVSGSSAADDLIMKAGDEWKEPRIQAMVPKMLGQKAWNPLLGGPRSAGDLDNLWSIFFATGDRQAIREIAGVLSLLEDGHGIDIAIGGAARWSLTSNAGRYPEVRSIVIDLHKQASGVQRSLLQEVIDASAENPHNQSVQSGQPSASR